MTDGTVSDSISGSFYVSSGDPTPTEETYGVSYNGYTTKIKYVTDTYNGSNYTGIRLDSGTPYYVANWKAGDMDYNLYGWNSTVNNTTLKVVSGNKVCPGTTWHVFFNPNTNTWGEEHG